jgi:hypothetical protein
MISKSDITAGAHRKIGTVLTNPGSSGTTAIIKEYDFPLCSERVFEMDKKFMRKDRSVQWTPSESYGSDGVSFSPIRAHLR